MASERKRPAGFHLLDGDIEVLRLVNDYQFLELDHIQTLTGKPYSTLARRTRKLADNRFLYCIARPLQRSVFAIGRAGLVALAGKGHVSPEAAERRLRYHELRANIFLDHALLVSTIRVVLTLAGENSPVKLDDWRPESPEIYDRVTFWQDGSQRRLTVRPDGYFSLIDSRRPPPNRVRFMLEADRSTSSRFNDKIAAYHHYQEQGLHKEKFSVQRFRICVICLTEKRALSLCAAAEKVLPPGRPRQLYLFGSVERFGLKNPAPIFESIFIRPDSYRDRRHSLMPALKV